MAGHEKPRPEFSRPVRIDSLSAQPQSLALEAGAAERAALAARLGLEALDRLTAELSLQLDQAGSALRVSGRFEADVVQTCVVTLEPVPARLVETVDLVYSLGHQNGPVDGGDRVESDTDDEIEPIPAGGLDLGETVAQQLSVALDPYPRAPGADIAALDWPQPGGAEASESPFAVLARLRRDD